MTDWLLAFWQFLLDYINTDHDFPCQIGTTLWKEKANDLQKPLALNLKKKNKIWVLGAPSGSFRKDETT